MMILFRHDDTVQVIIHTANMISLDWETMCQAVWKSPPLPLFEQSKDCIPRNEVGRIGSGTRFKQDLLRYLAHYGRKRMGALIDELQKHDFSAIRAAFVASVPKRTPAHPSRLDQEEHTSFGWLGLREILSSIPKASPPEEDPLIVAQVSSIALLGEKWIDYFFSVLGTCRDRQSRKPQCRIMFPTAEDIRRCVGGYATGASIHMKLASASAQKQLFILRSMMVKWAGDSDSSAASPSGQTYPETRQCREAGRRRAGPHIKTYTRYSGSDMRTIDWAMITSANLSKQAWGEMPNKAGEVRICSYEVGVVVWPELFNEDFLDDEDDNTSGTTVDVSEEGRTIMVPAFKKDTPTVDDRDEVVRRDVSRVMGIRMPYDLPLVPYLADEQPWCNSIEHTEPDFCGQKLIWEKK